MFGIFPYAFLLQVNHDPAIAYDIESVEVFFLKTPCTSKNSLHLGMFRLLTHRVFLQVNHDLAIANDIESVEAFFSKACAPGPVDGERICTGCSGDCSNAVRPSAEHSSVRTYFPKDLKSRV
jgi:hypothetical protein